MDKFEKKKEMMKKKMSAKNTWCDWYGWLINYIPVSIKKLRAVLNTLL